MKKGLLFSAALGAALATQAQIQLTPDTSATNLANAMVGTGTNVQNAILTCGAGGAGTYSNGSSTSLGMSSGIVLTSGLIDSIGSSASYFLSNMMSAPGDAALDSISTFPTYDACVLEFDVTVAGPVLVMDYVFASEEYPEFVCTGFNDAFAFMISGPTPGGGNYQNQNIALVPNSITPVSINTINGGGAGLGGTNCITTNNLYYVDNSLDTTIAFDGFTVPMTATIATIPGQTYHMRYAVSDASDGIFDTGVFLEGGSLKSPATTNINSVKAGVLSAVYPNPSEGRFNVRNKSTNSELHVDVVNMLGSKVMSIVVAAGAESVIDLTSIGKGFYLVNSTNGNATETQRILVK